MRKPIIIAMLALSGFISPLAGADEIALQDNPPQQYVVEKGDTLWSIASRFLKDPWRWPDVWNMNREQIKNPHRIFPGDMIVLDTSGGTPQLRLVKQESIKLSPRTRVETLESRAIPAIPPTAIGPFLAGPQIVEEDALDHAPYVVGLEENRYIMGLGDKVYVAGAGDSQTVTDWSIFRPGKTLTDPDTKQVLGRETEYLGDAKTLVADDVMTVQITRSVQEIHRDDRLVPASEARVQYIPHAPEETINGQIISAYGSVSEVGQYATVVINKGSDDGLEVGHVLAIYQKGRTVEAITAESRNSAWRYMDTDCLKPGATVSYDAFYDPKEVFQPCPKKKGKTPVAEEGNAWRYSDIGCLKPGAKVSFDQFFNPKDVYKVHCRPAKREAVTLPNARTGLVMVYRVFDKASYALVMNTNRPVYLLDVVKNP